jgi:hypothetical protein
MRVKKLLRKLKEMVFFALTQRRADSILCSETSMGKINQVRLIMLIPTFILGHLIVSTLYLCWTSFVLTQDSSQTQATIVSELGHGVVRYKYKIGDRMYVGQSQPSRGLEGKAQIGVQVPVNYCPHHPSLSSLEDPTFPPSELLLLIIVLPIEFLCLATVVNPKGKWALQTGLKHGLLASKTS